MPVALADSELAMMVAVPSETAVTSPVDETVATVGVADVHVTVAPGIVVPPASFTVAVSVAVSPRNAKESELGDNSIVPASGEIVTVPDPLADPDVAVIVAVPLATAVTSPADDTVAIVVSDVAHVTAAPEIAVPPASFTVAVNVTVSPTEDRVLVLGDTSTADAV